MEQIKLFPDVSGLSSMLESLLAATIHTTCVLETQCQDLDTLLHRWTLTATENEDLLNCTCLEAQQQQLNNILDRVGKAVKFSQCVREGREDVKSPWLEENDLNVPSPVYSINKKQVASKAAVKPPVPAKPKYVSKRERKSIDTDKKQINLSTHTFLKVDRKASPLEENVHLKTTQQPCVLHRDVKNAFCNATESPKYVEVAEAIDILGIPPELVTILKTFQRYILKMSSVNVKNKPENAYIRRLNCLNKEKWHCISMLSDCFHSILNFPFKENFCAKESKLPLLEKVSLCNESSARGWDPTAFESISVGTLCVHYYNEETWQLLQNCIEQLQLSHNQSLICDVLISGCFNLIQRISITEASTFLKAATALCRVPLLSVPFLVKTNDI